MLYFVLKNERKLGPFTESQLQELLSAGLISATDRAWKVEESEGTPLDQMFAGEQDPAEEELDTVHTSPIAVSQGVRPQELEAVSAVSHPTHQWDDSVVGPDVPHARGSGMPDTPNWPSERAPLNLDMDMDRLSSVDAILPLKVAVDYQERQFPSVLTDDEPDAEQATVIAEEVIAVDESSPEAVAAEFDASVVVTSELVTEQHAAADLLVTAEFPLTPMSDLGGATVTDVSAEDILAELAGDVGLPVVDGVQDEVLVEQNPSVSTEIPDEVPVTTEQDIAPESVTSEICEDAEPTVEPPVMPPVLEMDCSQPVVPAGLEAFFTPAHSVVTSETESTALVPVTAEAMQTAPQALTEEVVADANVFTEPVIPVAAPISNVAAVDPNFTGFQPATVLSEPVVSPTVSERRTAAERRAEDAEINDVCSRIEARLAERRMRSSNVRVVPTGGIAIFGGLLYAIPFVSLAVYGFAIQIATAGTFKITAGVIPYLVEAAAALLFHAYGVVVGHKVLTGDQKGRVYAERHLELRRFILPAIWMTLFFIAGPVPVALPGLPVTADAASQLALSPFQLRIFYMVILEQIFCGAWDIYFRRSRRVAETYTSEPYN